ncbi:MAG TPA: ABC-2 family transporter protein [Patescibacteria group bacterium]|nr:ABC-2 family transporter protein [Patescibacteria group bacterium]
MKRYIKIYWIIIKLNFSLLFAYRANFYNSFIISVGWGIVSVSSIFFVTAKVSHIYTWSRGDLYLLAGVYSVIVGLFHMFFSASLERFGRTISLGMLDSYLLTPIDTQIYLSTKTFRPISLLRLIIGIVFTAVVITQQHIEIHFANVFLSFVFIFFGITFLYSMWFLVITLMIWNPNLTNLIDFLYISNNFSRYPTSIVTYTKNVLLYLVLPLMLVTTVPAEFILGKVTILQVIGLLFFSLGLFMASRYFWKFALTKYTSASS